MFPAWTLLNAQHISRHAIRTSRVSDCFAASLHTTCRSVSVANPCGSGRPLTQMPPAVPNVLSSATIETLARSRSSRSSVTGCSIDLPEADVWQNATAQVSNGSTNAAPAAFSQFPTTRHGWSGDRASPNMKTSNSYVATRRPSPALSRDRRESRPSWVIGLEILRERQAQSASVVLEALSASVMPAATNLCLDFTKYRSVVTTGVGSSSAHAAYLSYLLRTHGKLSAWEVPTGSLLNPPRGDTREQALVVFSQGFSPNARLALTHSRAFGRTVLVTAARGESGERSDALKRAEDVGVTVIEMPAAPEYEVLLRILGPLIGYAVALRIAAAQRGVALSVDANAIATAIMNAIERTTALLSGSDRRVFSDPITFVTTGGYGALTSNLCAKVTEGMFLQTPVAVDAVEFAHGTLQQAVGRNFEHSSRCHETLHMMRSFLPACTLFSSHSISAGDAGSAPGTFSDLRT